MAAAGSGDVWAVGSVPNGRGVHRTLIVHWNGTAWSRIPSPNRGDGKVENVLHAVAATSSNDAWAVGASWDGTERRTLTLRWNGTRWSLVPSPSPGASYPGSQLLGVTAVSPSHAWSVGVYDAPGRPKRTLILRWNGERWIKVASPNPGQSPWLVGVAATSRKNAWAAGTYLDGSDNRTLIVRWNGERWSKVASPNAGTGDRSDWLNDVTATSGTAAWAVGWYWDGTRRRTLVQRWNGTRWSITPSPNVAGRWNQLQAVAAASADAVFAVGSAREAVPPNQVRYHTLGMQRS